MITNNEKKILRLLFTAFDKEYSINMIAKECNLSPNGAYKILTHFEDSGVLSSRKIANIKSYRLNFDNQKTEAILELSVIPELDKKLKYRKDDLKNLEETTKVCVIFGSYAKGAKNPSDVDILFVLDKDKFNEFKKKLKEIREISPFPIHDVIQTEEDLKKNVIKGDKVVLEALRLGVVLWGQKTLIKVLKDVYKR